MKQFLRSTKQGGARDDFKVLVVGCLVSIALLMAQKPIGIFYHKYLVQRPFITAVLEIRPGPNEPMLLYDADANKSVGPVRGLWVATVFAENGTRLFSRRGYGDYTDTDDDPRLWKWSAWFDPEDGTPTPKVPTIPFKVCLRYKSETYDTKVIDRTPEICTDIYDPNIPYSGEKSNDESKRIPGSRKYAFNN